jgi:flagellar basal body-associated protein FliL
MSPEVEGKRKSRILFVLALYVMVAVTLTAIWAYQAKEQATKANSNAQQANSNSLQTDSELQQTDGAINTVCRAINSIPKISESC